MPAQESVQGPVARRILLVDCDAFFVQVARLEDPEALGGEDLIIVGGRPGSRGVVASASYGARAYGVRSAMPTSQALRLCPGAVVVPVAREACGRLHREIRQVLEEFTPLVEPASIDEFYLDLSGTEQLYRGEELVTTARRIQRQISERVGIAVSIGGASGRLIAKLAVERAKPAGVHLVAPGDEPAFMTSLELRDLPGIGPVFAETLRRRGLQSVRDALAYDEASLRLWLGESRGRWLFRRLRGVDDSPVSTRSDARSISHERTFARDVHSLDELRGRVLPLALELATQLRRNAWRARTVRVYVRDRDFRDRQIGRTLDGPVESDRAIGRVVLELLEELWRRRSIGVRLVGVALSNLVLPDTPEQISLESIAPSSETARDRSLARAADSLRERFGGDAVVPARLARRGRPRED